MAVKPPRLAPATIGADAVSGAAGTELALSSWAPRGRPKSIILALHGYGDFAPATYEDAARYWAGRGIKTYAYDQRGFGRNADRRIWPGPDTLVDDLLAISASLKAEYTDVPLVVVGHSMGGGVALAAASRGLSADGVVLAAPAIAGGDQLDPVTRLGGLALLAFAPEKRFTGDGLVEISPTDNIEKLRNVASTPYHFADPNGRELWGLIGVMDRAARGAPAVELPVLTLMGEKDELLRPAEIRRIHERIPGAVEFKLYPDGWHWLFRDLGAQAVWSDVAGFALGGEVSG